MSPRRKFQPGEESLLVAHTAAAAAPLGIAALAATVAALLDGGGDHGHPR